MHKVHLHLYTDACFKITALFVTMNPKASVYGFDI